MKKIKQLVLGIGLIAFSGLGQAAFIEVENLTASWGSIVADPISGTITTAGNGTGTASMSWGVGVGGGPQSGYVFQTVANPFSGNVPPNTGNFLLGTFTHNNFPIFAPSLASAVLTLTADIKVDGVSQGSLDFLYDFTHDETPNTGGGNCCDDIVTIAFNDLSDSFLVDGVMYTMNIVDGSSNFSTVEGQANSFSIAANITASAVPNAATIALFGMGLLAFGAVGRRKA